MKPTSCHTILIKKGVTVSWPVEGLDGVECLCADAMRHSYGRHCHDAYAVGVIEAGVGGNRCRGADHFNTAGSIVVMNPGETHTGYAAGGGPLSYRMFYIQPRALLRALPEKSELPYFKPICIPDPRWAHRLCELHRCLESSTDPMENQARFNRIFCVFSACFAGNSKPAEAGRERSAIKKVKDYLQANYATPITIDTLAGLARLNRDYLIRCFSRAVGMPPYTYLTQVRVENAKKLLASGMPPVRAALEVGFADQSHLNRHFKKLTGTTPRLYRLGHYRSRIRT